MAGADLITLREKLSYGLGDFANGLIFNATTTYLMFFYTEHLGLTAAAASLLLFVARFWDALIDPLMGALADRTRTRFGRFRPYLLFVPVPLAIAASLAYSMPPLDGTGRLIWAYATHLVLMALYTAANIPYGAMPAVMTRDSVARAELTSFRMSGSFSSGIVINLVLLPLAGWYALYLSASGGGYGLAIATIGGIAIFAYWLCFAGTRERVELPRAQRDVRGDMKVVVRSVAWWCLLATGCVMFSFGIFPFYAGLYFLKYVVANEALAPAYFTCATVGMLSGSLANLALVKRMKPRTLASGVGIAGGIAALAVMAVPAGQPVLLCVTTGLSFVTVGVCAPILWAMVGDCADGIQARTGRSVAGLTTSAVSFSMKLGLGIGGALVGIILSMTHFVADAPASVSTQFALRMMVSVIPAAGHFGVAMLILFFPGERSAGSALPPGI